MTATQHLSDNQWKVAHNIAQQLALSKADANELGKAFGYLRAFGDRPDAGKRFFKYLQTLADRGKIIGHSKQTSGYFQAMVEVCNKFLRDYQDDPGAMQEILGWSFRLMRYYQNAGSPGESNGNTTESAAESVSEPQAKIAEAVKNLDLQVGQKVAATVTEVKEKKKGKKVTYEVQQTRQKLSKDEYKKKAESLSEGLSVTLEIVELKDDGSIKKFKLVSG